MANAHRHKLRGIRGISDETWDAFDEATKAALTDRSSPLRQTIDWYLRRPGAKLPERPPAGQWSEAPKE
ncbi:hypothetical protein G3I62_27290 [Streptomyces sp. SID14446]|uniref:hypothetical protein n=1 Tax=Streptomyces sp. SID14446 TaxID=2706072 RepID=UPI0013B72B89|nr:hypothetical protein [Streptomyces sp. SID14446]NEB32754.1 hypothetical protein [Streptomyces sp. SID14446]